GDVERWLERGGDWHWVGWSPDGGTAAVVHSTASHRNRAFLLQPGQEPRPVLSGALFVGGLTWAGDRLLALTDLDRDFVGLVELDPNDLDRPLRWLVDENYDVLAVVPDPSGRRAAVVVNEGPY